MAAHTYPDPRVSRYVSEVAIPVQFNLKEDPGAQLRFHSFWTPTVILQDVDGIEHRRSYGALDPDRFLAELALGRALRFLHTTAYGRALDLLEDALALTEPDPLRNAENLYWLAVGRYRVSSNADDLFAGWRDLIARRPGTDWAERARRALEG